VILNDNLQRESDTVQSTCLSPVIAATMYQRPSVHLGPSTCRCCTDQLVSQKLPGGILLVVWLPMCQHEEIVGILTPPPSDRRNTLFYAHKTSRTLSTSDMRLGLPSVAMPEAGDFVESLELYLYSWHRNGIPGSSIPSCFLYCPTCNTALF
jgi:hypothetical protein